MNVRNVTMPVVAALLATLTLASSASAECAWVLWLQRGVLAEGQAKTHEITDSFETKVDCAKQVARIVGDAGLRELLLQNATRVEPTSNGFIMFGKDGVARQASYLCLPDTVDPRGARGK
jgi:hypothetical protein